MHDPIRKTTLIELPTLAKVLGLASLTLATETFQVTGSFKFRAAYTVASNVPEDRIIAASSGNFGQALACACGMLGKACVIVMPAKSAKVKIDAVKRYGGVVDLIDTQIISRQERINQLRNEHSNAYIASAYDDELVIRGNSTLGDELSTLPFDHIVVPIGGGGLSAGVITGLRGVGSKAEVIGAEPLMANDAAQSLREGHVVANTSEPQTIADGARTISLGRLNWPVLQSGLAGIIEVPEAAIRDGVRTLFSEANLKAEPTGALALAAVKLEPTRFAGKHVCCVVSGGNVDPRVYAEILTEGLG